MSDNFPPRFLSIFRTIIGTEGGYVNNPKDPGGETKYGISKRSYPHLDIANLTLEQAQQIYFDDFYMKLQLDQFPIGIDEFVFDFAVNSGQATVARIVQRAVGCLPDGIVGPNTINSVKATDPKHLVRMLFVERAIVFAKAPQEQFNEFCHGWYARLFDQTELMLQLHQE